MDSQADEGDDCYFGAASAPIADSSSGELGAVELGLIAMVASAAPAAPANLEAV